MKTGSYRMSRGFRLFLEYVLAPALLISILVAAWVRYPDDEPLPPTQPTAGSQIKASEVRVTGIAADLERALRWKMRLAADTPLTVVAVRKVKDLDLDVSGVESLAGIENFRNLESLNLSTGPMECGTGVTRNDIQDLTPLAGMATLRELNLSCNAVADISPLKSCTALRELNLFGTRVIDLSPLASLPELESLNIANCGSIDFSTLPSLPNLRRLSLTPGPTVPTDLVARLPSVTSLRLDAEWGYRRHPVVFDPSIYAFPGLTELACIQVQLPPLDELPLSHVEHLDLSRCKLESLCGFPAAPNLRTLVLQYNAFTDVEPLRGLQRLAELDLTGCYRLEHFEAIEDLPRLKKLSVLYTGITHASQIPSKPYEELRIWSG